MKRVFGIDAADLDCQATVAIGKEVGIHWNPGAKSKLPVQLEQCTHILLMPRKGFVVFRVRNVAVVIEMSSILGAAVLLGAR